MDICVIGLYALVNRQACSEREVRLEACLHRLYVDWFKNFTQHVALFVIRFYLAFEAIASQRAEVVGNQLGLYALRLAR